MDSAKYEYMDSLFLRFFKDLDTLPLVREEDPPVIEAEQATILPCKDIDGTHRAGVLDKDGAYIDLSGFDALVPIDRWTQGYDPESEVPYMDLRVMYFGRYWPHWGHFIMDEVVRLWYAIEREPDILIAYDATEDISGVYADFFKLAGIAPEQLIRVSRPTRFASVVIPGCAHVPGRSVHQSFERTFAHVTRNALASLPPDPSPSEKVYLSRTQLNRLFPFEVGEKEIERFFCHNGYRVVAPEKESLARQIAILQGASSVACISGTLPHTMMFARTGTQLIIVRKTNKPAYRQMSVNQIKELDVTYVDAHVSPLAVGSGGPFMLDVNDNLRRFAKAKHYAVPRSELRQFFARKLRLLWYIPFYCSRNIGKHRYVPLYLDGAWGTLRTAKRQLFSYYLRRL